MAKGLRIGNKIYPDKIICDGCRKEIDIDTEEIRCSKCVSNLIEYIKKLESQISSLKSQLANIKYLNANEVRKILLTVDMSVTAMEHLAKITRAIQAICNLAIQDIDRDKIIEVLRKYFEEYNFGYLDGVTDEIIKAIMG